MATRQGGACDCRVQFSPWVTLQTTVGVTVKGAEVTDVYGNTFPTYTNTSTIDHRYAPHHDVGPLAFKGHPAAGLSTGLCCVQVCLQESAVTGDNYSSHAIQ